MRRSKVPLAARVRFRGFVDEVEIGFGFAAAVGADEEGSFRGLDECSEAIGASQIPQCRSPQVLHFGASMLVRLTR